MKPVEHGRRKHSCHKAVHVGHAAEAGGKL